MVQNVRKRDFFFSFKKIRSHLPSAKSTGLNFWKTSMGGQGWNVGWTLWRPPMAPELGSVWDSWGLSSQPSPPQAPRHLPSRVDPAAVPQVPPTGLRHVGWSLSIWPPCGWRPRPLPEGAGQLSLLSSFFHVVVGPPGMEAALHSPGWGRRGRNSRINSTNCFAFLCVGEVSLHPHLIIFRLFIYITCCDHILFKELPLMNNTYEVHTTCSEMVSHLLKTSRSLGNDP